VATKVQWQELYFVAATCLVALVISLGMTLGRATLAVALTVDPARVVVGEQSIGQLSVVNRGSRRALGARLEVPVGAGVAAFDLPQLASGTTWDEPFVIPTRRRGIVEVGPVSSVRGDPLGLARRAIDWADAIELFVHPQTVRVPGLTAGWIRDLEGRPTNDLSPSDVAFHTLREYVPGDDRRHVHWRTSARLGTLMVRQFVDTRRSHLGLVLSTSPADYADAEEFELAVSIVGSLGVSALGDDQVVSLTTGQRALPSHAPTRLLDALAGVEQAKRPIELTALARRSVAIVRGASVVALVVGSGATPASLRAAADVFHHDVRLVAIRAVPGRDPKRRATGSTTVLDVGSLAELGRAVRVAVNA
jgi:uncharacterized protein (DUF58 family)